MSEDARFVVSKVGQQLIEHVMRSVLGEYSRSATKTQDEYVATVLQLAFEALCLAQGWMEIAAMVAGFPDDVRLESYRQHKRMGQAIALDKFEADLTNTTNPKLVELIQTLEPEIRTLREARQRQKEPMN